MNVLKQHWRFLATLVVLAVLLFYGYSEVGAKAGQVSGVQKSVQGSMAGYYRKLYDDAKKYDGKPATSEGLALSAETVKVQEIEKRRNNQLRWETDAPYTLAARPPESTTEDLVAYYLLKRQQLLRDLSYQPNVTFAVDAENALGFATGSTDKLQPDRIAEMLARLDMVKVVARSSLSAGVQSLRKFEFDESKLATILAERGLPVTSAGRVSAAKEDAGKMHPPYLLPRMLKVSVRANEQSLYDFLVDLQRPVKGDLRNRYLAVEGLKIEKPDALSPSDDLLTAEITLVAYRINEDAPLPGSVKSVASDDRASRIAAKYR